MKQKMNQVVRNVEKGDYDSALENLRSLPYKLHAEFIFELVNAAVESCFRTRRKIGRFLFILVEKNVVRVREMRHGLQRFMEIAEDLEVDVPRLWFNLGQICAPLLSDDRVFPYEQLGKIFQCLESTEKSMTCMREIITEASNTSTKERVLEFWNQSLLAQESISKPALEN